MVSPTKIVIMIIIASIISLFTYAYIEGNTLYKDNSVPISKNIYSANITFARNDFWQVGIQTVHGQDIGLKLSNGTYLVVISTCEYFQIGDNVNVSFTSYINSNSNTIIITSINGQEGITPIDLSCGYVTKI